MAATPPGLWRGPAAGVGVGAILDYAAEKDIEDEEPINRRCGPPLRPTDHPADRAEGRRGGGEVRTRCPAHHAQPFPRVSCGTGLRRAYLRWTCREGPGRRTAPRGWGGVDDPPPPAGSPHRADVVEVTGAIQQYAGEPDCDANMDLVLSCIQTAAKSAQSPPRPL